FIDIIIDGQEMRQKVIKRSVHLYSLFTALYELTLDDNQLVESHIENYRNFIDNYDSDESLKNIFSNIEDEILIYKALSQEGTRAQNNRLKRHNIIMKILNY